MLFMSWRSLLRIGVGGVVCALLVLAAGWLAQRVVLGVDDAGMRMRVETEVRSAFDRMARRLREMALEAGDPATIRAAIEGDTGAVRRLVHSTAAVVSEDAPIRLCAHDLRRRWPTGGVGRASDPTCRPIASRARKPGSLRPVRSGLRLMYVRPVMENGTRLGDDRRRTSGHARRRCHRPASRWSSGTGHRRVPLPYLDRRRLDAASLRGRAHRRRRHDLCHRGS